MRRNTKGIIGFVFDFIIGIVVLVLFVFAVKMATIKFFDMGKKVSGDISTTNSKTTAVEITIPDKTNLAGLAKLLKSKNLIKSEELFVLEGQLFGRPDSYAGGTFQLSPSMNDSQIIDAIKTPSLAKEVTITIPEGFSIKDIATYLDKEKICKEADFLAACKETDYDFSFLDAIKTKNNYLEGYLFPDTYRIYDNSTPQEIVGKMLSRFDEVYTPELRQETLKQGKTIDEVVTVASIIEKEMKLPEERAEASSVIYNRLSKNENLQLCSTILYALGKTKAHLVDEDLNVKSPYNTYVNGGLPYGPISNPGQACIAAALNPANTDYMYFVVKDEKAGSHKFTDNYNEFLKAKALYKQKY